MTNGVWPFKDKQCTSRRVFAIRVPARTTRVTVGGKRVRVRGRRARVDLRGLGKRTVTVRIVGADGTRAHRHADAPLSHLHAPLTYSTVSVAFMFECSVQTYSIVPALSAVYS